MAHQWVGITHEAFVDSSPLSASRRGFLIWEETTSQDETPERASIRIAYADESVHLARIMLNPKVTSHEKGLKTNGNKVTFLSLS